MNILGSEKAMWEIIHKSNQKLVELEDNHLVQLREDDEKNTSEKSEETETQ